VSAQTTIQRYLRAVEQHDYGEVIACFADDAVVVHPIFGRQPAAGFFQTLFAKTSADKADGQDDLPLLGQSCDGGGSIL
jgi:ketosteroid isomerase-like protein